MRRFVQNLVFLCGFVLLFGFAVSLQRIQSERLRAEPEKFRDWLYLPSSQYVQWTTLGYDQLAADMLWLRAIQAFGATFAADKGSLPQLASYFNVITDLDPKFLAVYTFGNLVIGEEGGDHEGGLAILDKGIARNPDRYRLAFEASFFTHWIMNDSDRAKLYARQALKAPDCPEFVRGWIGFFDKEMGRYIAAYHSYFADFAGYYNAGDSVLTDIRYLSLRRALSDWYVAEIRRLAIDFETRNGRQPTITELENAGAFLDVELPDFPRLDAYVGEVMEKGGKFPEDEAETQRLCNTFLKKDWTRLLSPKSDNRHFPGYIIWPGQKPFAPSEGLEKPPENSKYVKAELDVVAELIPLLTLIDQTAKDVKTKTGKFPPDDSYLPPEMAFFKEPWGGAWVYEPETGRFYPGTHPDLFAQYLESPRF